MNKEKIEFFRNKLIKEKTILEGEIVADSKIENFGNDVDHFEEKADEADAFGSRLSVAQDLKIRLDDIDLALQKIEAGEYGVCEKCQKPIEEEILNIDPESHLCKDCKLSS